MTGASQKQRRQRQNTGVDGGECTCPSPHVTPSLVRETGPTDTILRPSNGIDTLTQFNKLETTQESKEEVFYLHQLMDEVP